MPIYEFHCPACGNVFERKRPREKAGAGARCPEDGKKANRVFGAAVIGVGGGSDDFGDLGDLGALGGGMPDMGAGMPGMGGGMPGMDGLDMGGDFDF